MSGVFGLEFIFLIRKTRLLKVIVIQIDNSYEYIIIQLHGIKIESLTNTA